MDKLLWKPKMILVLIEIKDEITRREKGTISWITREKNFVNRLGITERRDREDEERYLEN